MKCDHCGREPEGMAYTCSQCNERFCEKHRLPESHRCPTISAEKARELSGTSGAWFKDEFQLSNVDASKSTDFGRKHPADEESEATTECKKCGKLLRDHEIAGCPYCGEAYCGEHLAAHRSSCSDSPAEGVSTDQTDKQAGTERSDSKTHTQSSKDTPNAGSDSRVQKTRREQIENKQEERYRSPDVNLDGSIKTPAYDEEINDLSSGDGSVRNSERSWLKLGLIFVVIVAVVVLVLATI